MQKSWRAIRGRTAARRVLFYSGNDNAAKAEVAALIERIGFVGIDLGSLEVISRTVTHRRVDQRYS